MIDDALASALRELLHGQRIASLGTLHGGEPYVSMAPFAVVPGARFVIHVSTLAAHTRDMLEDPRVSLLVMAARGEGAPVQGWARVTLQGDAAQLEKDGPAYERAKQAYLDRFPESEPMFGFGDFSLFEIVPRSIRYVGGFAQAKSVTPETLGKILHE